MLLRFLVCLAISALSWQCMAEISTPRLDGRAQANAGPERGFYTFRWEDKSGNVHFADVVNDRDFSWVRKAGFSLVSSRVSLENFRSRPISSSFLDGLRHGLASVRNSGIKVILRFNYNNGNERGNDASIDWIVRHINQLSPILKENADIIFSLQAGFIGAWGEWHSSTHNLDSPGMRKVVVDSILASVPASTNLQIRYPQHKQELMTGASPELDAKYQSRIGFHNDCILSAPNDLTYPNGKTESLTRYVAEQSVLVLVGGETCRVYPPRTDCKMAMQVFREHHYSYLNNDYDPKVIAHWKSSGCYDSIRAHLGYRLTLRSASIPDHARRGQQMQLALDIKNTGWAAPISSRELLVDLVGADGKNTYRIPLGIYATNLKPGITTWANGIHLPADLVPGNYDVYIVAPDPSARLSTRPIYSLPFENPNYEVRTGRLPIGALNITED